MKFKKLVLENYQAHKNTTINFTAGLNIIIGESDTGKSSILRALRKLVRDIPAGKDHINKDATSMKISLTIIDDNDHECVIIRQVTASKNLYYLDSQEFGGFGREIPEEIQNTLEMFVIELENSEKVDFHFSDQHDTPFMIAKGSAGMRSKLLGRIAGLHTLDKGIVNVNKDIRAGNSTLKIKLADRNKIQAEVDESKDTAPSHILHNTCKMRIQTISDELTTLHKLKKLQTAHREIIDKGKETKKLFNSLPEIVVDFQKLREDIQRCDKFISLRNFLDSIDDQIKLLPTIKVVDIDFVEVRENIQKLGSLQEYVDKLSVIDNQIKLLSEVEFDINIKDAQEEWATALITLKICPLCKQSTINIENCCK